MITRVGNDTLRFERGPWIAGWASSVGKREKEGPLGDLFDQCHEDTLLGADSWEQAESLSLIHIYPLLWLAYFFFCRDLELACDEKVIREHGEEMKKPYSRALIRCAAPRKGISVLPPAFGETGIRERVKNVLRYRKPPLLLVVCAAVVCAAAAVCLLTRPPRPTVDAVFSEDAFVFESQTPRGLTLSFPLDRIPEAGYSAVSYTHLCGTGRMGANLYHRVTRRVYPPMRELPTASLFITRPVMSFG